MPSLRPKFRPHYRWCYRRQPNFGENLMRLRLCLLALLLVFAFVYPTLVLAENLPKHLPGNPTAVVQSMPGAASVKAANFIYSIGPQDGTLIGIPNHAVPMNAFVWREVGDGLDVTKLNWIGRLDAIDVVNVAWHTAVVNTIEDVKQRPLAI